MMQYRQISAEIHVRWEIYVHSLPGPQMWLLRKQNSNGRQSESLLALFYKGGNHGLRLNDVYDFYLITKQ
jgi:hypothetical protein